MHTPDGTQPTHHPARRGCDFWSAAWSTPDYRLPGMNCCTFIRRARQLHSSLPAIVNTAFPDEQVEKESRTLGADVLAKPIDPSIFEALVEQVIADA